jgi:BirA family biotin operon repressor/biotin-[acetyl-CoA-carboxylase] ligase
LTLSECASTNDVALQAAAERSCDGLAVFSDFQTAGRGRMRREWVSPRAASILCSVAVEEPDGISNGVTHEMGGRLTLLAGVAVCEAIELAGDITPSLKWPNDVRVQRRKLAGVLIDSRAVAARGVRAWVIGIGINCLQQLGHFPPGLRETTTSLEILSTRPVDRVAVARALLQRLDAWLAPAADGSPGFADAGLHERWLHYAEPLGGHVRLVSAGQEHSGHIVGIDPAGGLVLEVDGGGRRWFDPMLTRTV